VRSAAHHSLNSYMVQSQLDGALYSQSPKCQRELSACAAELEVQVNSLIGRVLTVRWVASSCRTVAAVWKSYAALHEHFSQKAVDASVEAKERCKFDGLKKTGEPSFCNKLGFDA